MYATLSHALRILALVACLTAWGAPMRAATFGLAIGVDDDQHLAELSGAVLDAVKDALLKSHISAHDLGRCWRQLNRLTDEALVSLSQAYEEHLMSKYSSERTP